MSNIAKYVKLNYCHEWELYGECLITEIKQCEEEGKDISAIKPIAEAVIKLPRGSEKEALADELFELFNNAEIKKEYAYNEPSSLEEIKAARPAKRFGTKLPENNLHPKIYGAWLGRICGCLLGKPVEGMRTPELHSLLKEEGNFPLKRYIGDDLDMVARYKLDLSRCWSGHKLGYMPPDDDTNYTVMASEVILKNYGRAFTPQNVAQVWLYSQPISAYCTAERVAYKNFVNGIYPPESAIYKNPFREWIGAQIRADYFGYINPGNPELAAEMAWRDASISHVKNGIYGEMFIAAALAAAAVCDDIKEVIYAGLGEIPENCRLSEAVKQIISIYESGADKDFCFAEIHRIWNEKVEHDWCHTISNAMICVACLLYGELDYGKSICMAVETGFDTDCNGATVGSIVGMIIGADAIPSEWSDAVNDTVATTIVGCGTYKISELAEKTFSHM